MTSKVQKAVRKQKSRGRFIVPVARAFLRSFMMLVVLGASAFGVWKLWDRAMADPRFLTEGETLMLNGAMRECPESVEELGGISRRFNGRSILDPTLLADMEKAYGESIWIREVSGMRRRFPNRVEVEFLLRLPAAQVWHGNRYWLVDDEACVLPVPGSATMFANLPEIAGATPGVIGQPPRAGATWSDEGVRGALGIMRAFWGSPLAEVLPVDRVVVTGGVFRDAASGRDAYTRRRFEVVSTGGAVVRWGTYNSGDLPDELTSSQKLYNLRKLIRRDEAAKPGVCFDIRTRVPGYTLIPEG